MKGQHWLLSCTLVLLAWLNSVKSYAWWSYTNLAPQLKTMRALVKPHMGPNPAVPCVMLGKNDPLLLHFRRLVPKDEVFSGSYEHILDGVGDLADVLLG